MTPVLVFLAEGFEEIEALTVVDVLRRAEIPVRTVAIDGAAGSLVKGAHGIAVQADETFAQMRTEDAGALVLPGGLPGTTNLEACESLCELLCEFACEDRPLAAICAAPMVLGHLGLLEGRKATIYPGMEEELRGAVAIDAPVVTDGNITTGRGPGAALPFALELVRRFCGEDKARTLANSMCCA